MLKLGLVGLFVFIAQTSQAVILWNRSPLGTVLPTPAIQALEEYFLKECPFSAEGDYFFIKNLLVDGESDNLNYTLELSTLPFPDQSVHTTIQGYYQERGHEKDIFTGVSKFETIHLCFRPYSPIIIPDSESNGSL